MTAATDFALTPFFLAEPQPGLLPLAAAGWTVHRPQLAPGTTEARLVELYRPLADGVAAALRRGRRPVSVAGDCCSALGVAAGLQRADCQPILIWFDAHGDFNTPETSPGGFLGGMPLAMLTGRGEQEIPQGLGLSSFPEERVILTDARDLDPGEGAAVAASAVTHLRRVEDLLELALPDGPLWVHFDVDVVDTEDLPAVQHPAPGGPTAATVARVFRHLAATGRVAAVSVSTWEPDLDADGRSRDVAMGLLGELVG